MNIPPVKALLPLRSFSVRVPNKNVRLLCGRPLFHWILTSLTQSQHIREIIVDTDSPAIAENASRHFNVTVLMRPERLHGDMVDMNTLIDFQISSTDGEFFLQTHATNPLLQSETIDMAIEAFFAQKGHDSLFSVTSLHNRLYWQDGHPINHNLNQLLRTQDLPPVFVENSNLYLFSRTSFYKNKRRIGDAPLLYPMPAVEAADIDEECDFLLAEFLMMKRLRKI